MQAGVTVKAKKIVFTVPTNSPRFWQAVGTDSATGIVKRTQAGVDVDNRRFKSYAPATKKQRTKRGRSPFVNLTDTGRMLGSIHRGIRAAKNKVFIKLTGRQAFKAFNIEKGGREFFWISKKMGNRALVAAQTWVRKKNKLR